ncbi:unnamed protein product, partial [Ectocarpus sp. 8 AP-2014]
SAFELVAAIASSTLVHHDRRCYVAGARGGEPCVHRVTPKNQRTYVHPYPPALNLDAGEGNHGEKHHARMSPCGNQLCSVLSSEPTKKITGFPEAPSTHDEIDW